MDIEVSIHSARRAKQAKSALRLVVALACPRMSFDCKSAPVVGEKFWLEQLDMPRRGAYGRSVEMVAPQRAAAPEERPNYETDALSPPLFARKAALGLGSQVVLALRQFRPLCRTDRRRVSLRHFELGVPPIRICSCFDSRNLAVKQGRSQSHPDSTVDDCCHRDDDGPPASAPPPFGVVGVARSHFDPRIGVGTWYGKSVAPDHILSSQDA